MKYLFFGFLLNVLVMLYSCNKSIETIKIGSQVWMLENLDVERFRNGDPIPEARSKEDWIRAGELGKPAWCNYGNVNSNGRKYGKLYNWYAVNDTRGLAPDGWHIPRDEEWELLEENLGGGELAGAKMRDHAAWADRKRLDNKSYFKGLPGGYREYDGFFSGIDLWAVWWSAVKNPGGILKDLENDRAYVRKIWFSPQLFSGDEPLGSGLSVRCIKNY